MGKYAAIIKTAEYENITKAAKDLGYTQANLSHVISRIECDLQISLFHRVRQGVKLTRAGKDLLGHMYKIEEMEQTLINAALSYRKSMLRIGSFYSISAYWMPEVMMLFQQKHPDTVITVIEKESFNEIDRAVALSEVDCAFFAGPSHSGFDFFPLYEDPYYVVVSDEHPLAKKESTSMAELQNYPFVMPSEGTGSTPIRELINKLQMKPNLLMQTQGDLGTLMMVEKNFGFSILPGLIAKNTLRKVRAIPLEENISRHIGIISKPYSELSEVTRAFIQTARRFAEEWVPPRHEQ